LFDFYSPQFLFFNMAAIFDLSQRVHGNEEIQLKAQRIAEEHEIQRQAMQDASEFSHLMAPSTSPPVVLPTSRRQSEPQPRVITLT
jgi:prophage DNA circulation protein